MTNSCDITWKDLTEQELIDSCVELSTEIERLRAALGAISKRAVEGQYDGWCKRIADGALGPTPAKPRSTLSNEARDAMARACDASVTPVEPNEQLSAEGKAGPAGDASDSGRVAHRHTNAGETPAPRFHTTEDDFLHFLSYSKLSGVPHQADLRLAYYAGADVGLPTAVKSSEWQCKCGQQSCPYCGEDPHAHGFVR